jgi:hypothetical protein
MSIAGHHEKVHAFRAENHADAEVWVDAFCQVLGKTYKGEEAAKVKPKESIESNESFRMKNVAPIILGTDYAVQNHTSHVFSHVFDRPAVLLVLAILSPLILYFHRIF